MISVVIPLYNKEKSISTTLRSVIDQSYTDYEVIVVDDGSTDRSADVVCDFIRANDGMSRKMNDEPKVLNEPHLQCSMSRDKSLIDGKIRLISQANGGVSAARNRGVMEAKGEYIAFLDGDDIWEPTYLEEAAKLIHDFPDGSIYGVGIGRVLACKRYPASEFVPTGFRGIVENLWDSPNTMLAWTSSSTLCPRALALKTLANEHLTHGEDLDQWLRLMLQGDAVFYNKTLAYYVQDAENRAMHRVPPIDKHIVSIIDQYAEARENNAAFRKAFDTQMIYLLYEYLFTPYKKEAQRLAEQLDYSQLKRSLQFRMKQPHIYIMYLKIKSMFF